MRRSILLALTVALLAAGAVAAALPRDGTFKGTTSQKQKLTIQVLEGAISTFAVTVKCGTKARQAMSFPAVRVKPTGAFAFKDAISRLSVSGTFTSPTAVSGKITPSGPGCKPLTFTARR